MESCRARNGFRMIARLEKLDFGGKIYDYSKWEEATK